ncbi:helix-turn-helix domain-containing protein [Methanobrevibacter filiformis]|uniref:Helix-turn-helix protein n=1 Tax=Methanobrevibacter filiformis TaxID=55758 RepID=A0A166CJW0_9EURY|nr:helix-turn-helix transcriptional regulator [Methanobrevibacter filiformis]KZX14897.1 helix-turn-helix protein [Methanobrevibacter filiformis]
MEKIGVRLKKLRDENEYTQEQIANYLEIDQGQVSKIEKGDRSFNLSLLDKICLLYNCSHEYILGKSDEYSSPKFAFRLNTKNPNLEVVSKMNQIMANLKFLRDLDSEE